MPATKGRTSHGRFALLLGLITTLIMLALYLLGAADRIELLTLDLRFRRLPTAPPNDRILHVDIDDRSLDELGRWPWPRTQLAGIVEILHDAGADAVALDIIFPEPQATRFVSEAAEVHSADTGRLLGQLAPQAVFDDAELRQAMRRCGRVFLPMHIELHSGAPTPREAALQAALEEDITLSPEAAARRAGLDAPPGGDLFHRVRTRAIEALLTRALRGRELPSFADALRRTLPQLPRGLRDERGETARRVYLRRRGLAELERFALDPIPLQSLSVGEGIITPPLVTLAQACYRSGFVTVEPDSDGIVRRIPLLASAGGKVYPQFALAIAIDQLANQHGGSAEVAAESGRLVIRCGDGFERAIPLDEEGMMLINWIPGPPERFPPRHVSTAKFGAVWLAKQAMKRNVRLRRRASLSLLELGQALPSPRLEESYYRFANELAPEAVRLHDELVLAEANRQAAMLFEPAAEADGKVESLRARQEQVDMEIDTIFTTFREALADPAAMEAFLGADDAAQLQQRREDAAFLLERFSLLDEQNAAIARALAEQMGEVRALVAGKLCLIGSTATGAADFVPTPVDKRMAGVTVHSNILNTITAGAFVRRASLPLAVAAMLAVGLAVAALASSRPVLAVMPLTVAALGTYLGVVMAAFRWGNVWLPVAMPLASGVTVLLAVTAYRQLTEERAKRQIRGMFAHALSPALVDRLMEDPDLARLGGERRELTFFFSDLQGFTPLSERLGEEGTVRLLNRYFDRMTDVIQNRRGGYLNKFLGDGLFVFFGAPVFQADHAARALAAAVDCQHEVSELNRQLAEESGGSLQLACRVGLSTGEVMVGNCGSTQRMDYTAIGDPVNLASRLESANKFFGTKVLIADETWRQSGCEDVPARPLGRILVVGKNEPVSVWSPLLSDGRPTDELRRIAERFADAIDRFARRDFNGAIEAFESVLQDLPDDKAAEMYLALCRQYLTEPPPDGWAGELQLTGK